MATPMTKEQTDSFSIDGTKNLNDIYYSTRSLATDKDAYELALDLIFSLRHKSSLNNDEQYLVSRIIAALQVGEFYSYEKDGNRPVRKNDLLFLMSISFVLGMTFVLVMLEIFLGR